LQVPMLKLMGWTGWNFALMPYGPLWRAHRRSFEEHFRASAVTGYQGVQLQLVHGLLKRILNEPDDFMLHIRHSVSAIIMRVVYGYQVKESDDPFLELAREATESATLANFGNFLVDLIPWLRYVPQWFPGAGFQRKAAHWGHVIHTVIDRPWTYVKNALLDGTAAPSIAAVFLEGLPQGEGRAEKELIAKNCAAIAFMAGADTTVSAAQSFFLAMTMFPEVQKKAQAELDAVVGRERLPDFNDHDSLPYIDAVVKEILRWQPAIPVGVPHFSMQDDEYEGYFFPGRTLIIGNAWSILHDPEMYSEPEEFRPDRFLKDGKPNPDVKDPDAAFGYGRRVCPGQFMATRTLWAIVSSVLSVFDISPSLDEAGKPVQLQANMTDGLISYPLPFKCIIKPRSQAAASLIRFSVDAV